MDPVKIMQRAQIIAQKAWGMTEPNPMVGALLVENGKILSEGFHAKAGEPHAEVKCLTNLSREPSPDSVLYVTMEPCSTKGNTGACTDRILQTSIKKVIVGCLDPNPVHAGAGIDKLRNAGLEVTVGLFEDQCHQLNFVFNHHIVCPEPLRIAFMATDPNGNLFSEIEESSIWKHFSKRFHKCYQMVKIIASPAEIAKALDENQIDYWIHAQYLRKKASESPISRFHWKNQQKIKDSLELLRPYAWRFEDWMVTQGGITLR